MTEAANEPRRRAIVTGGARGLGRAMALGLLEAGHSVMVLDRDDAEVEETIATARARSYAGKAVGHTADITAAGAPAAIVEAAVDTLGGIDVLINNAGVGPDKIEKNFLEASPPFDTLSEEVVRLFFEVNAIAPVLLAIHAARHMRAQRWGRILNVTTSHDSMLRKGFVPYGGTKASLEAHTVTMAKDLADCNGTANVLAPGGAANTRMQPPETGFERSELVQPEAMIAPLLWLISDAGATVTAKKILAAVWTPEAIGAASHPAVMDAGWPGIGSQAIYPKRRIP